MTQIILASGSSIRAELLRRSRVPFEVRPAKIDEDSIMQSLLQAGTTPRDLADALAEAKARKVSSQRPDALVIGCDQTLDFHGKTLSKPDNQEVAVEQLASLRGQTHKLLSAAVIFENAKPVWRHVGQVTLTMRDLSDEFIADYIKRNWESIQNSVGAYKLEEEGPRLLARIDGDHFNVLGIPLLELLSYLTLRGTLEE